MLAIPECTLYLGITYGIKLNFPFSYGYPVSCKIVKTGESVFSLLLVIVLRSKQGLANVERERFYTTTPVVET